MLRIDLGGGFESGWSLSIPECQVERIPASVPGSVYHDLLHAGIIEDPFVGANELKALPWMDHDFIYERAFDVPEDLFNADQILLRAEGLDTIAKVFLNDQLIGCAENMHRIWEYDAATAIRHGQNTIRVEIASPTKYIKEAYEKSPQEGSSDAMTGFPLLRKAHCMFGWDWGPHLPDAGIWRAISLIGIEKARIEDVRVHQIHEDGKVSCEVITNVKPVSESAAPSVKVSITSPRGEDFEAEGTDPVIAIQNPELWWPNGFGAQPLYTVLVRLMDGEKELDRWEKRIGLRTLTMHIEKDQWGESFCHRINGIDVFAMGADYIPEDNLLPRVNRERTYQLLSDAKAANMNTIRVWGGGYYPDDFFYDVCDELGLLVWQDFMFACAAYDLTQEFEANIRAEFVDNIRRLRNHPSLAIWCGNNEMEMFALVGNWVSSPHQKADYIKMYEYILPQVLRKEDPDTFYWPASPSSGGSFDNPNDENRGDVHYWAVWHALEPFTAYRKFFFRYASEFGFQSFPCMDTIRTFAKEEDMNPFSYVMEKHQRNSSANGRIAEYLSQTYLYPTSFDGFVYASQLLQAQAIQYGVEHWRRNRGRCMGAIVWQLNDCWPVVSWASLDYYGRWKALHYAEKRFFSPVLISCEEEGIITQNTNVNAEPFDLQKTAHLNVTNESLNDFTGKAHWALRRPDATVIREGEFDVFCPALSAVWLPLQDFHDEDTYGVYYSYELQNEQDEIVSSGTVLFCAPKHFRFQDPKLKVSVEGNEIVVQADAYARAVEIQAGADTVLSDNFFDMNAGERRIKVVRGTLPEKVTARSVYDIR